MLVHFFSRDPGQQLLIITESDLLVLVKELGICRDRDPEGVNRRVTGSDQVLCLLGADTIDVLEGLDGDRLRPHLWCDIQRARLNDLGHLLADLDTQSIALL